MNHAEITVIDCRHRPFRRILKVVGSLEERHGEQRMNIFFRDDRASQHFDSLPLCEMPDTKSVHSRSSADVMPAPAFLRIFRIFGIVDPSAWSVPLITDHRVLPAAAANIAEIHSDRHMHAAGHQMALPSRTV